MNFNDYLTVYFKRSNHIYISFRQAFKELELHYRWHTVAYQHDFDHFNIFPGSLAGWGGENIRVLHAPLV